MVQDIFNEYARFSQVCAMAVGGSRAIKRNDRYSDYDVYVYCLKHLSLEERRPVLEKYCGSMALDNHFRGREDVCIMKDDGAELNIIYRGLDEFLEGMARIAERFEPLDRCTTTLWHSLMRGRIAYDKGGHLAAAREKYSIPYPQELKNNIISYQMNRIKYGMPSIMAQTKKAMGRGDLADISRNINCFLDSYFDVVFALNEMLHPGEKRLVQICVEECEILPANFELNIRLLLNSMCKDPEASVVGLMVSELEKVIGL